MRRAALLLALAACAGCSTTLTRLPPPRALKTAGVVPIEAVEVSNANLLLLSFIPLASGDPAAPNAGECCWFTDTLSVANQFQMLEAEAARVGATRAVEVATLKTDESLLFFLLQREKMHTSAILVKDSTPASAPRPAKALVQRKGLKK